MANSSSNHGDNGDPYEQFCGEIHFYSKSKREHLADYFHSSWKLLLYCYGAVIGSAAAAGSLCSYFGFDVSKWLIAFAVCAGLLAATYWTAARYKKSFPDGFEAETNHAKYLAQHRPPKWECMLAKELLNRRLVYLEKEFQGLEMDTEFVPKTIHIRYAAEYQQWSEARVQGMYDMVRSGKRVLFGQLMNSMFPQGRPASPMEILEAVNAAEQCYKQIIAFEREAKRTHLPQGYETLFAMQLGWTQPVRNMFSQFAVALDHLISIPIRNHIEETLPSLNHILKLEEPHKAIEWSEELSRSQLELLAQEHN